MAGRLGKILSMTLMVAALGFVWSAQAQANMDIRKLYKGAFEGSKPKCIMCHVDKLPKKVRDQILNRSELLATTQSLEMQKGIFFQIVIRENTPKNKRYTKERRRAHACALRDGLSQTTRLLPRKRGSRRSNSRSN